MKILVAGGMGYIGSILSVELLKKNHEVIIVDNLSNVPERTSKYGTINSLISDRQAYNVYYRMLDVNNDFEALEEIFEEEDIDLIINLAADKSVENGENNPDKMFQNNINIQTNLLRLAEKYGVDNFIFASTATVYTISNTLPFTEDQVMLPIRMCNYGYSKYIGEELLERSDINYINFRFFNVIGASEDGVLGELGGNNIVPKLLECSANHKIFKINGNDYNTIDGTPARDYIDVNDIIDAITLVIDNLEENKNYIKDLTESTFNLGTGKSVTVKELVDTYNDIVDEKDRVKYEYSNKRPGDEEELVCDPTLAEEKLDFVPRRSLEESLRSAYKYYKQR